MTINLPLKPARVAALIVEVGIFIVVVAWIAAVCVASMLASGVNVANLQRASRLDPSDADYFLRLGRVYEYTLEFNNHSEAVKNFRRGLTLSPLNAQAWLDLAAAEEFQGNVSDAEVLLRRADTLAPNLPAYQWKIGNYFMLHGNTREAFRHLQTVLMGTRTYDTQIFHMAWKATSDPKSILANLIPQSLPAEYSYLAYLINQNQLDSAQPVWERILKGPGRFPAQSSSGYMDTLILAHQPEQAYQVWTDLQRIGALHIAQPTPPQNLLTNGDFEDEILNLGFGWRIDLVDGVYATRSVTEYHSPSHSVFVQFYGKKNLEYRHVYQYVGVTPSTSYRLQAYLKTEDLTTDSGPRIEVRDTYDPKAFDVFTDDLTGHNDWTLVILDLKTGPQTKLATVSLTRLPSRSLDNLIMGKVWLDDVQLVPRGD